MSITRVPDITVHGGDVPTDELLERFADLLLALTDEPSDSQGETNVREADRDGKRG